MQMVAKEKSKSSKRRYQWMSNKEQELLPISIHSDVIENCSEDVQKNKCNRPVKAWVSSVCKSKKTLRQVVIFRHIREHPCPECQQRERYK
jgi:hypothetical protein